MWFLTFFILLACRGLLIELDCLSGISQSLMSLSDNYHHVIGV